MDARADLYQVGLIMQEMVTGKRPRSGKTTQSTAAERKSRSIAAIESDIPKGLETFIARALSANRDDRFQTAKEMLAALKRVDLRHRSSTLPPERSTRKVTPTRLSS